MNKQEINSIKRGMCPYCERKLKPVYYYPNKGEGCLLGVIGIVLAPALIGIPLLLFAYFHYNKKVPQYDCISCGSTFPRA